MRSSRPHGAVSRSFLIPALILFLGLSACTPKINQTADEAEPQVLTTGNDKDGHGCIATAGYTWSKLLTQCIRLFEVGTELINAQDPEATLVAYAILDPVINQGELFLPETNSSITLRKQGPDWVAEDNHLFLTERAGKPFQLKGASGTILYQIKP